MQNTIFADIAKIDKEMAALYTERVNLDNLRKQHEKDIADRTANAKRKHSSAYSTLDGQIANTKGRISQKYSSIIHRDREYIADLQNKCCIAAKNNDALLRKYGAIPNNVTTPPDLTALFTLFNKIMNDTAESFIKRTLRKDGYYAQDAMVQDFIKGAARAIAYLNFEINVIIPRDRQAELDAALQALQPTNVRNNADNKQEQDLADVKRLEQQYKDQDNASDIAYDKKREAFFSSELITGFARRVEHSLGDAGFFREDWLNYNVNRVTGEEFVWGNVLVPMSLQALTQKEKLSQKIPGYFGGFTFKVPMLIPTRSASKVYVQYDATTKAQIYEHIQAYTLQKLRSNPGNHLQVYYADPNDRGQNMGVLIDTAEKNEEIGIRTQNTKEGIRDMLKEIVGIIDTLNGELGKYTDLFEYNEKSGAKRKETVVVLCDVQNCIEQDTLPLLKVIWENATRCGISVFLTSTAAPEHLRGYYPNMKVDWSFISSKDLCHLLYTGQEKKITSQYYNLAYSCGKIEEPHHSFMKSFRENYKKGLKINNEFELLRSRLTVPVLTEEQRLYGKAYNGIKLPIMIDTSTNGICQDFIIGTDNSQHTLITGGTGSGKSRLLQMIISSIIMNYHPDDVELWLIDCKKVEFNKFLNLRPPHVRMVSLERTQDFTFAFLDYLKEFADNRTRLLRSVGENGVANIKEYRKAMNDPYCMPRVVIIIDEFHAITTNVNMDMKYRQLLEDALAEYRNLGISFIFSDQSVSGLKGLTEKGRQQLHNRVAMKNTLSEMKETLQLLSDNYAPGTLLQMEKSEGIGDFWWNRNPNVRYKTVRMEDEPEADLINEVIARGEEPRQDTKVILVDGNERNRFESRIVKDRLLSAAANSYRAPAMQFCLGAPTTLDEMFSFGLNQKYNNNILIAGRDSGMTVDVVASMIRCAQMQEDTRIIVLADCVDDRFRLLMQNMQRIDPSRSVEVYDEYSDVCKVIAELHAAVKSKRPLDRKTLVFWLGISDMYDEFCVSPAKPESLMNLVPNSKDRRTKESGGFVVENVGAALNDPELIAIAEGLGISVREALMFLAEPEEQVNDVEDDDELTYNANQDMFDLFALGGKFGLFNVVSLEFSNDARHMRGLNTDNFLHKIAFCMSRDESVEWGLRTTAAELTEGLTALYTDGITQNIFRPYINI